MNKLIINFLLSLKNSALYSKPILYFTFKLEYLNYLNLLYNEGFILFFLFKIKTKKLVIALNLENQYNLKFLKFLSTPSKKRSLRLENLYKLYAKISLVVLSTSKGLITSYTCKNLKVGGQALFIC